MSSVTLKVESKSTRELAERIDHVVNNLHVKAFELIKEYRDISQEHADYILRNRTPLWLKARRLFVYNRFLKGEIKPLDALKFVDSSAFYGLTNRFAAMYAEAAERHIYTGLMWKAELYDYAVANGVDSITISLELHKTLLWIASDAFEQYLEYLRINNFQEYVDLIHIEAGLPVEPLKPIDFSSYYYGYRSRFMGSSSKFVEQLGDIKPKTWYEFTR